MPKRSTRKKNHGPNRPVGNTGRINQNAITRIRARSFHNVAYSTTANSVVVNEHNLVIANMGSRVIALGDTFMYWRLLAMRLHGITKSGVQSSTNLIMPIDLHFHGAAFIPASQADYTAPTTINQFIDFPEAKFQMARNQLNLAVGRQGTIGEIPYKWLHTTTTGVSAELQTAGTITVVLENGNVTYNSAAQFDYTVEYLLEFKGPIDTAIIPAKYTRREYPLRLEGDRYIDDMSPVRIKKSDCDDAKVEKEPIKMSGVAPAPAVRRGMFG